MPASAGLSKKSISVGAVSLAPPPATDDLPNVKSALRVVRILEYFAASRAPASLSQLSKRLDLPKSSCHALLETLRGAGYLYWLGKDTGYYPTRRWNDMGSLVSKADPFRAFIAPYLAFLCKSTGETAIVSTLDGDEVLYLDVVESTQVLRYSATSGERKPLHSSASGRALLAHLPGEKRNELIGRIERTRFSDATLVDPAAIAKVIEEGAARGWHVVVNEHLSNTTAIAVSFPFGLEIYSLTIGAPTQRVSEKVDEIGRLLAQTVRDVTGAQSG